ncbi:MAG: ORC1-type DNA replication protein [Candidatus Bathyarchaeia archaeon]|jgi:cell division control protein 6|nr:ORC1-type DNA replication protein [Candidatus Bathyarchaeota archaeon A05DMB-4]MDH7596102.1 ORC1-type DNA replication protein [Candidatus Bathyarchaeota archaeon]
MESYFTVFKDESKLDINYLPPNLSHRETQLNLLTKFFQYATEVPGKMAQRALIVGKVGTGKTALAKIFGLRLMQRAQEKGISLRYVHVNCRERKGSLFMILQQVILDFYPHFPKRGYSSEELLQMLLQMLDEKNMFIILVLDELEALIQNEGADSIYKLTRIQESRLKAPQRLSLVCIIRELDCLDALDESTKSTLQRNIIFLEEYTKNQLRDILNSRVALAFRNGVVDEEVVNLIAEQAEKEHGNARYAIELLWRAGKYADASGLREVSPDCVRRASSSVYPTVQKDAVFSLELHEKLFLLGVARRFKQTNATYITMGEAEEAYYIVCEEYGEKPRGHTQLWKYVNNLSATDIIGAKVSEGGVRGKTTLIELPFIPAEELERELSRRLKVQ